MRKEIAGARDDRGHSRANIITFDDRCMTNLDVDNVGNCVKRSGWECADDEADVSRTWARLVRRDCVAGFTQKNDGRTCSQKQTVHRSGHELVPRLSGSGQFTLERQKCGCT